MIRRRFSQSILAATAVAGLGLSYVTLADQPASAPAGASTAAVAPATLRVAKLDPRKAFAGFSKGDAMQKRFAALQKELGAAQQGGNNEKAGQISHQIEQMQEGMQKLMIDALHAVTADKKIDLVLGVRYGPGGVADLNVVYKEPDTQVPDITPAVVDRINSMSTTRPALDSQPASEPAGKPMIKLNPRPKVHIDAPKPSK